MRRVALLALAACVVSSCDILREGMSRGAEIQQVEAALRELLAHKDVNAYLENTPEFLKVEIRNSPLRDLPSAERRSKALQIAEVAYRTYASGSRLKVINVVFVVDKTESSALASRHSYDAMASYEFRVDDLGAAAASPAKPDGKQ